MVIRSPRRRRGDGDGGYNLVALMVAVTVMNSLVAIALPAWSHILQREREAELIFRGLQYAEAIRVFQQRFQRPPLKLKELIEVEPRSIRQLWENPISEEATWTPIYANAGNRPGGRPGGPGGADRPNGSGRPGRPGGGPEPGDRPSRRGRPGAAFSQAVPQEGDTVQQQGPIVGVVSSEGGEAIKTWMGSRQISDWKFEVQVLTSGQSDAYNAGHIGGHNLAGQARPINSDDLGRPFPPGVVPPNQQGGPGQGTNVGGSGAPKTRPGQRPGRGGGGR